MRHFQLLGTAAIAMGGLGWLVLTPSDAQAQRRGERGEGQKTQAVESQSRGEERGRGDSGRREQLQAPRGQEQRAQPPQAREGNARREQAAPQRPQRSATPNAQQQPSTPETPARQPQQRPTQQRPATPNAQRQPSTPETPARQPQQRPTQQTREGQQPNAAQQQAQRGEQGFARLGVGWENRDNRLAVGKLEPNSAAAQIGLQQGDQVASIGGRSVANQQQFDDAMRYQFNRYGNYRNYRIPIVVYRGGVPYTLYWTWPALALAGYGPFAPGWRGYYNGSYYDGYNAGNAPYQTGYRGVPMQSSAFLGVDLDQRTQNAAVVQRVYPGSAAEQAGLNPGDVIWAINGQSIDSPGELSYVIGQMQPGQTVDIRFSRPTEVQVALGDRNATGAAAQVSPATPTPAPAPNDANVEAGREASPPAVPAPSDAPADGAQPSPAPNPQPENASP